MASELRVLFDRQGEDWTLRLVPASGSGTPGAPFPVALSEKEYEGLRWYLEDYMDLPDHGSVVRARGVEERIEKWGRALYDALFRDGDHRELLRELLAAASPRLLTIATDDSELLRLPWELIADRTGLLTRQGVTIRRQLEKPGRPADFGVELPLRLLIIVSRPADLGFIDPRLTTPAMLDALEPLGRQVAIDFCRPPTVARMEEMLAAARDRGAPYHAVHFEGHGTFLPDVGLGALCYEAADGSVAKTDYARADRLGLLLAGFSVPLVILEACRTSMHGKVPAFRSVAPRLVDAGVGSVLAMSHAVHVEATRVLLTRFYRELVAGKSIGQALEAGRGALIASPQRWIEPGPRGRTIELKDWFLPTLYQQGEDLQLVPAGAVERLAARSPAEETAGDGKRWDAFLSYNHADAERVEGIARELRDAHGLRVFFDRWEIPHGSLRQRVVEGVRASRFLLPVISRASVASGWVDFERDVAHTLDPRQAGVIPLVLDDTDRPPDVDAVKWYDLRDPARQRQVLAELAEAVGSRAVAAEQIETSRRQPPERGEPGAFPWRPLYGFHGRARELYRLEGELLRRRAVLLHAMGGMGKTALAREAAFWWTRTGLFPDGACFLSFEQGGGADKIALTLGTYLEGHEFEALPAGEQLKRARELFEERRVLMVWDNFESTLPAFQPADGKLPLYPDEERGRIEELFRDWTEWAKGRGRLLVTCRPAEAGLLGVKRMELEGLARPDSLHLLAEVLERHDVSLDDQRLGRDAVDELLDLLGDHPLSIELVAPHLKDLTPAAIARDFAALLETFEGEADVGRNRSLLASLEFSLGRLGEVARQALPWLGLFRGGVFEQVLLWVSELDPGLWQAARRSLEDTALLRVEREILYGGSGEGRPYLRFHPTLAWRAAATAPATGEVRRRFVGVYLGVRSAVHGALFGSNHRGGLDVMAREEANFRRAVAWALEAEAWGEASAMGETFRIYLERSGRLRERDGWAANLAAEVAKGGFSAAASAAEREAAWALFTQGRAAEAVARLEELLARLGETRDFDSAFQIAHTQMILGRVFYVSGHSLRAIPILEDSVRGWEALTTAAAGRGETGAKERGNLAATLGHLATASMGTGRLDEALKSAERALVITRELGHDRDNAASVGRVAQIMAQQGRFDDANRRYGEALDAARRGGDRELEAAILQHSGGLATERGRLVEAAGLYRRALKLFQDMHDDEGVMQTCNLLGLVDRHAGRLAEARTWHRRSREIAEDRGDEVSVAIAAQNLGIVLQQEGEAARGQGDETTARRRFEEAAAAVDEGLTIRERLGNPGPIADSYSQLAQIHHLLGDLDHAEEDAHRSRKIRERLGLKEAWKSYGILADVAHARGDAAAAEGWEKKRDDLRAELERRAGGGSGLSPETVQAIGSLAVACVRAGLDGSDLPPQAEAALHQLEGAPPPLDALVPFLRALAAGEDAAVPEGLPGELRQLLAGLLAAVAEAGGGG